MPPEPKELAYDQAIEFLYQLKFFGAQLGLERALKLAALAGNPQNQLSFIHVAGTNGKGSTCAMLESIYQASGLRVGLYTSPHLVSFGERIQVNRRPIPRADITRLVGEMQALLSAPEWHRGAGESVHAGAEAARAAPTFFEIVTVMALRYFAEQQCDLVIWETGLGGRLDATNIVIPLASVITNIQLDHQEWLGDSLSQIASEKAGIIKSGVPVITATDEPEALRVLDARAKQLGAPLTLVERGETRRPPLDALELPLWGEHQRLNAALALAVVRTVSPHVPVPEPAIREGLLSVIWPGRFQVLTTPRGSRIILDGAHNPAGIATLRATLERHFPGQKPAIVLGVLRDKDYRSMCRLLVPLASRLHLTPVSSERSADPEVLRTICREIDPRLRTQAFSNLSEALKAFSEESLVLVTGSLHFIGEAMEALGVSSSLGRDERALNEWVMKS